MAAGKEIRDKIKSFENTKKITKAMEMVSVAKMRSGASMRPAPISALFKRPSSRRIAIHAYTRIRKLVQKGAMASRISAGLR